MVDPNVYGIVGEGRTLCRRCAERFFGDSLEMYLSAGEIQVLWDGNRSTYAGKGVLCDDCFAWIFRPDKSDDTWWLADPDPDEHLRLLAPFADFLETIQVDVMNLRNLSTEPQNRNRRSL